MLQNRIFCKVKYLIGAALVILSTISFEQVVAFNDLPVPERCSGLGELQSISLTDWESGLGAWSVGRRGIVAPDDFKTPNWGVISNLPDSRIGKAAFADNIEYDSELCSAEVVDQTGVITLDSPLIEIPQGALIPRISIDHWFAIEIDFDGGNFKISVNGGVFNLIPAAAIEVGPYNRTLFPALTDQGEEFSTNPLAGQDAFSGPLLNWGQSHINLQGIAAPGDNVRLRLDFGLDECNGDIGWYVDDVEFYSCSAEIPPSDTKLTLVKTVINDNGGSASASAWTLSATGRTSFSGSGPSVSSGAVFAPGTYNLSESGGPAGYSASAWVCVGGNQNDADTITLALDDVVTCTITNNDISPTLKVVKSIINDSGGTEFDEDAFGLRVDGVKVSHNISKAFNAGSHTVSEDGLPNYEAGSWGGDCDTDGKITLVLNQDASCTITNDDIIDPSELIFKNGFE